MKIDRTVNVIGNCCPTPLIELADNMKDMRRGQIVQIIGDDPIFERGMRDYCEARGHLIMDVKVNNNAVTITIQV